MSLSDEIRKLSDLRDSGVLSAEEFEIAKRKVLAGEATSSTSDEHLIEIKTQNELAQIDREWQIEREKYMVNGRYGGRQVPTVAGSVIAGVVIALFGTFWTAMAVSMPHSGAFPMFGLLFIALGVGNCIWSFTKANQYQEAERRYQRRRSEWLSKRGRE